MDTTSRPAPSYTKPQSSPLAKRLTHLNATLDALFYLLVVAVALYVVYKVYQKCREDQDDYEV